MSCVTIEQVAINLAEARIPDNAGDQPSGEPLQTDGAPARSCNPPQNQSAQLAAAHDFGADFLQIQYYI